jgi:hypothetical protein
MNYDQASALAYFTEAEQQDLGVPAQLTLLDLYKRHTETKAALLDADSRLGEAAEAAMTSGVRSADEYQAAGEVSSGLTPVLLGLELVITEIEDTCLRNWEALS